jgi:hypothetical protein
MSNEVLSKGELSVLANNTVFNFFGGIILILIRVFLMRYPPIILIGSAVFLLLGVIAIFSNALIGRKNGWMSLFAGICMAFFVSPHVIMKALGGYVLIVIAICLIGFGILSGIRLIIALKSDE